MVFNYVSYFAWECWLCFLEEKAAETKAAKPKEAPKETKSKEPSAPKVKEASKSKGKDAPKAAAVKSIPPKPVKTKVPDGGKGKPGGVPSKSRDKALKAKKAVLHGVHNKRIRKQRNTVHFRRPQTMRLPRTPKYPRKSTPKRVRYVHCCSLLNTEGFCSYHMSCWHKIWIWEFSPSVSLSVTLFYCTEMFVHIVILFATWFSDDHQHYRIQMVTPHRRHKIHMYKLRSFY